MNEIGFRRLVGFAQWVLLLSVVVFGMGLSDRAFGGEVVVSAAISLKDVFGEIAPFFERANPGTKLVFNFGGSGQLKMQIESGAPADVFVSAAMSDMDALETKGVVVADTRQVIAKNALVLIRNRTKGPRIVKTEDLAKVDVKRVAVGNPATVPAGRYAKETLEAKKLYEKLQGKLVFSENVRQVLDYVARGEVDAGFVYRTDALLEPKTETVEVIAPDLHKPIQYSVAALKTGKNPAEGKLFAKFLQSDEARQTFKKYGFE